MTVGGCSCGADHTTTKARRSAPPPGRHAFVDPVDVAFTPSGQLWVADYRDDSLTRVDARRPGVVLARFGRVGGPNRLAVDRAGVVWAALYDANEVAAYRLEAEGAGAPPAVRIRAPGLSQPTGLAFDARGWLWVTNQGSGRLLGFTPAQVRRGGRLRPARDVALPGGADAIPEDVGFTRDGTAWVAQYQAHRVVAYRAADLRSASRPRPTRRVDLGDGAGPVDVAIDPEGHAWVADADAPGVWDMHGPKPRLVTLAQSAAPHSLTWDPDAATVWVTDPSAWLLAYEAGSLGRATAEPELVDHEP
jgi:sugar lactone lactonase YvrE